MTSPVALNGHDWRRERRHVPADWELEAAIEYWDRALAELSHASEDTLAVLHLERAEVVAELARRARLAYARAQRPFDLAPIIEEVKQRADVVGLFERYCERRQTINSLGKKRVVFSCFYHPDKTPSLTVWSEQGRWYCFSCANHGDAIAAVMKLENLDFVPAVIFLARELSIAIPERPRRLIGIAR